MRLRMMLVGRWLFDLMMRLSAQGAVLILRISSEWPHRSMKWLSIFRAAAHASFSATMAPQTELPRGDVNTADIYDGLNSLLPLWEKVARSAG
ncbi:hypothetical protein JQ596_26600 [Bradyrhizobium manausense]|uniref:hypothetical protein n=1 Tax=Bradyrhizobium TaxID=374 RepID=UPI001BAD732E|nr:MULTISPECIES: hypothetical protein [Bradyrhizobium]MBR0829112.1 hypothetical protein [Bradyrhizobium manausense]UVO29964.1 hypothetical protein KUF59_04140 [Bradyrhizobium arachidis]